MEFYKMFKEHFIKKTEKWKKKENKQKTENKMKD